MGFWDVDENDDLVPIRRRVKPAEMNASVMLALAHGAKGIIFWNYYSYYNSNNRYRYYGIVKARDSLYAKTDLYYKIQNDIAPRLTGALGNRLKTLKYEGDYAHERYGLGSAISDDLAYLDISSTAADSANFHAGLLMDSVITDKRYYMIVNLIAFIDTMTRDLIIELGNPLGSYSNFQFKNIESSYNYDEVINLCGTNTFIDTITFSAGGGHLYELKPVLKYGGNLVYDDTISTAITLSEPLTIKPNADLSIEAELTVDSDVYVEAGGAIKVNSYDGNVIVTSNGSIEFETWDNSLIGAKTSNDHPRLIWQNYPEPVEHYKIHRKYGSQQWNNNYATTSNNNFTDQNITINAPGSTAGIEIKYKVSAVYYIGKVLGSDESDEVNYQAEGSEIEKKGSENNNVAKPTTFALEQNHPNPFNPTTVITYQVPTQSEVTIKVYDILGKEITELVNTIKDAGFYSTTFNASNLSSGTYIYRMAAGQFVESRKMIILK